MIPTILWFACGLPTAVLATIRVQLWILSEYPQAGWVALGGGLVSGGLILGLVALIGLRLRSLRGTGVLMAALLLAVVSAGGLGVARFPERSFKGEQVRAEWGQLHPTLRLALWVAHLAEPDLVLTDVSRLPDEYGAMGLPQTPDSHHYVAADGFARAVDVRVSDAGALRNWARQGLFLLMGLEAGRHAGTADHLHVSIPQTIRQLPQTG